MQGGAQLWGDAEVEPTEAPDSDVDEDDEDNDEEDDTSASKPPLETRPTCVLQRSCKSYIVQHFAPLGR